MKVLLINGSPRRNGNTARALREVATTLEQNGLETEIVWIGNGPVRGCAACMTCRTRELGRCVFDDDIANRIVEKLPAADAIILGSPTYYGQPAGQLLAVWQRVCFSAGALVEGKPAASVAICRRGGSTAAFQCLNMPFEMLNSILIGSQYWNIAFGMDKEQCELDAEGMQTMRTLGRNMAWVVKNLRGKNSLPPPDPEAPQYTHFIR